MCHAGKEVESNFNQPSMAAAATENNNNLLYSNKLAIVPSYVCFPRI